jgi:hypothetical protein
VKRKQKYNNVIRLQKIHHEKVGSVPVFLQRIFALRKEICLVENRL